jgi:hypothetical protein
MFSTSFSGGWNSYAERERVVSSNNKARQKSQKISDATTGKTKKRKPENKGKHRKQDAVITGSGQAIHTAPLGRGGSASQNVIVNPAKAKNRAGAGRPPKSFKSYGNSDLDGAFKDRYAEKQQKKEETDAVRQRREAREDRVRQEDVDERRRERGERQRQFNIQQQGEARKEQQRQQDRAQEIAREQAREVARERRELEKEQIRQEERAEELRIRDMEARGRLEVEERIARQQLRPLIEQGAITLSNIGNTSNVGNVKNVGNPTVNLGDDPATRRRRRGIGGRGGGGGGRRSYGSSSDSSGDDGGGGGGSQLPTPSPRNRREQQRSSASSRRGGRTPRPSPDPQPTTPEEEASLLGDVASGVVSGVQTLSGGLVRAGGGFIGGVGGAIAEQLPSAETIGDVAGRGAVAIAGSALSLAETTGRTAVSLVSEAVRPQREIEADPSLLQSISEGEESGGGVKVEPQQPVKTIAEKIKERQEKEKIEYEKEKAERLRQKELRDKELKEKEQTLSLRTNVESDQAGILADIQSGAGRVISLVADTLRRDVPLQQRASTTTELEEDSEDFSSGGEGAGKVLIRTDEPQASFRETYVGTGDISETDEERRIRVAEVLDEMEKEELERQTLERQTSRTPTPAQVIADVGSGTEGIFRQFGRIVETRGDVLEDPVESPDSPRAIQLQEDEASARRLEAKLKSQPQPEPEKAVDLLSKDIRIDIRKTRSKTQRPIVVLEKGKPFTKPSNQKTTKSEDVIRTEYKKLGVDVAFVRNAKGDDVNFKEVEDDLKGKGYVIYQKAVTPRPAKPPAKPPKADESESELSTDTEPKFRDVKKLSPKQLVKTAEQLQKQQKDVDERLSRQGKVLEQKDRQIVNLSQRALLLDTEQSGGGSSDDEFLGSIKGKVNSPERQSGSSDESQGEYDLRRYGGGRTYDTDDEKSDKSGGDLLEGDDY